MLKGWGGQPVSAQTTRRTLHQITAMQTNYCLHGCHPKRKSLLKMTRKKAHKQFAEDKQTKDMDYWNPVLWSDETKINIFGSDGVKRQKTKTSVSCLQSSLVVGVSWSRAAWVLPALGSYSSLREPWMPKCSVTYWSRSWSPPFGDWAAGQYSNMITTLNTPQDDHCLAKEAEGKDDGLAKHVSRPKPYWASVGHPQTEGGGVQGL